MPPSHSPQVNPGGSVYESGTHDLTNNPHMLPWVRNYASSRRGVSPGILYNVTKGAYTVSGVPLAYKLDDYFRICPKASRRATVAVPRHLTAPQDYSEGAGHPLVQSRRAAVLPAAV